MPYSKEHKQKTRQRILNSAGKLFPRKGYDAVSINDLMSDAGLTRGAFYHHFTDKADVYAQSILHAALQSPIADTQSSGMHENWLTGMINAYLSREHIDNASIPCPLAFLATDISNREAHARKAYARAYCGLVERMAAKAAEAHHDAVLAATALMIGGVAIGRALDNPAMTDRLLTSCRQTAKQLLHPESS